MANSRRKWTKQEDKRVVRQVERFPQNLQKCFYILSEVLDRTPNAIENRWYSKLSKDPNNLAFFTASRKHVSKNRKNGMGTESNLSIWKRLIKILKQL